MAGLGSFNAAAATKSLEKLAQKTGKGPIAKNVGPLKGGIGSLPVSQVRPQVQRAPATKPAPRMFSQGLASATRTNYQTGGRLAQYSAQHPQPQGLLGKIVGGIGKGVGAVERVAGEGLAKIEGNRSSLGMPNYGLSTPAQKEAQNRMAANVGLTFVPGGGLLKGGEALKDVATGLETARAAKGLESATIADRALGAMGGTAAEAPGDLRATAEAMGTRTPTVASKALRVGAGAAGSYGKMLIAATPAKAALPGGPPRKNEPFAEKFWHSAIHTIASFPAATIETAANPIGTIKGMAHLYTHPEQAWNENPAGTALAFLAPFAGAERGAGGLVRKVTGGKYLSTERPDLQYMSGQPQAREFQPGLISNLAQRAPDKVMKALGKGEKELRRPTPTSKAGIENMLNAVTDVHTGAHLANNIASKGLVDGKPVYSVNSEIHTAAGENVGHVMRSYDPATGKWTVSHIAVDEAHQKQGIAGGVAHAEEQTLARHGISSLAGVPVSAGGRALAERAGLRLGEGDEQIKHLTAPENVNQATKLQERRDILGSRLGGLVRPGQVDLIRGGERLANNLETMKGRQFLNEHLPHDDVHATALMTLLEGTAKTAKDFWPDVAERVAQLKDAQHGLTGTDLAYNKEQVGALLNMEQRRSQLSTAELEHYENAAGQIASRQREMWGERNQEGVGEPDQLNARNLPALLLHGHLMNRGALTHVLDPGEHEFVGKLKAAKAEQAAARGELIKARTDLAVAKSRTAGFKAASPAGTKTGLKVGKHWEARVGEAQLRLNDAVVAVRDLENKLSVAKMAGAVKPNGHLFPGVYDQAGKRVTPAETEKFINENFGGREMGFVTQKQNLTKARSQNSYGPRSTFPMRTGGNFMAGAYDNSPAALRNHFDAHAHNIATLRGRRSVAENLALLDANGHPMTEANAKAAADNMNRTAEGEATKQHLGEMVPYNLGTEKTTAPIEGHPYTKALEQQGLVEHKALNEEMSTAATWGIMPKRVADRLDRWDKTEKQVQGSMLRLMTTPWRQTNLYTSARWPFGTTQENAARLAFHQVSPLVVLPYGKYTSLSFSVGSDIVRMLDEKIQDSTVPYAQKQAAIWHRSQFGTGNFVGAQLHELEPALHELSQDSFWGKVAENPLNTKGWRPFRRAVGGTLNKMETNAKIAAGGKLALNDAQFFDKFNRISREQAAHDYVEKLTTDPAQSIKAAQNLMEVMGNWNHLTPYTRQAQAEYAPFALWWLNSAKFIFKTLPRDHPYATGLLAAMVTATGVENRNLKPYLEGTIPLNLPFVGQINLNPVHYSPFDIANEPLPKAAGMVMPQFVEPAMEAKGVSSLTGESFTQGNEGEQVGGEGTSFGRVALGGLESYIPGMRLASQLLKEGGEPTKTSILPWEAKKGSKLGLGKAAAKSFAPFMFTYERAKKGVPIEKGSSGLGRGGRVHEERVSESRVPETRVP